MRSALFAILVGLVGAALLHIVIILALPNFTGRDGYSRVLGLYEMDSFFPLSTEPGATGLANDDPFLRVAVCGFFGRWRASPLYRERLRALLVGRHLRCQFQRDFLHERPYGPLTAISIWSWRRRSSSSICERHPLQALPSRSWYRCRTRKATPSFAPWHPPTAMRKPCETSWPNPAANHSGGSFDRR